MTEDYLLQYTEKFAKLYIKDKYIKEFKVGKVLFNYTESFITKKYKLPGIINSKGREEYVILTPSDISNKSK